jgi:hypothetical protein
MAALNLPKSGIGASIERNQGIYKPTVEVGKFELLEEIHGR